MSIDDYRVSIETKLAEWTTLPVFWRHDRPSPPPDYIKPWVAARLLWGPEPIRMTLGGAALIVGVLDLVIHTKPGAPMGDTTGWADELRALLSDATAGDIRFGIASPPVEDIDDERWQRRRVSVRFETLEGG